MEDLAARLGREKDFRILETLIIGGAVMVVLMGASGYFGGDAVNSRLATVYSLANYGTWFLERPTEHEPNRFEQGTIDKVVVNGHLISSKPPVLPLLMTAEYLVLHKTVGWDLDDDEDTNKIVRVMSITLIGFSYLAAVVFFYKLLCLLVSDPLTRVILLFGVAFCTQLWGYATHINNHVPAAGMLVIALYFALGVATGKLAPRYWRFLIFGLTGALVATLDLPGTVFVALAGLYLLAKHPAKTLGWVALGASIPVVVHCAAMFDATGSVLPVQNRPDLYLYEGSYWRNPQGIDALNEPKGIYLFHMTFGRCGLFSLYPILFAGMAATVRAVYKKAVPHRGAILVGALGFFILTAYYAVKTNNYGGEAYGVRWYIVAMPVLLLMGAPIFMSIRARWKWFFIAAMIGISFYSAFECAKSPWGANRQWTCRLFLGPTYGPIFPEKK
jgi:hypothetical protein